MINRPATPPPPHLLGVLRSLWQWRKPILITTVAGTLLAVIISLLLPVYYTSQTSFLAINPAMNTIEGVFGNSSARIGVYGNGDDIDRLLAISESDQLVDHMVQAFGLYDVYAIDSTKLKASVSVRKEFLDNYEVTKTARDVIELSISDRDPRRAADMARSAREKINEISLSIIRASQSRTAASLENEVNNRDELLREINTQLEDMRSTSGIYNTGVQGEVLSTMASSLSGNILNVEAKIDAYRERGGRGARDSIAKLEISLAGLESSRVLLDSQLIQLNTSIGPLNNLEEERQRINNAVAYDRIRLKQMKSLLGTPLRTLETVEEARVPVVKSRPVRSLIVLGGAVFSFLIALLGVLLAEGLRRYDWQTVFE